MLRWAPKGDREVADYYFVWQPRMSRTNRIVQVEATVTSGTIEVAAKSVVTIYPYPADQTIAVRLMGGAAAEECMLYLWVKLDDGQELDEYVAIAIRAR